jgi:hypothetical protein
MRKSNATVRSLAILLAAMLVSPVLTQVALGISDEAEVTLTIDTYLYVSVQGDITMMPVPPSWFGFNRKTWGSQNVDVVCNVPSTLRTDTTCVLTGDLTGNTYNTEVEISLTGDNPAYWVENYVCIDFPVGEYIGGTDLIVSLRKTWGPADLADTYHGLILMELILDTTP